MMLFKKISFITLGLLLVLMITSVPAFADEIEIKASEMNMNKSDGCLITETETTDSYGNNYQPGIFLFAGTSTDTIIFDLNGEYASFTGAFVVSDTTPSGDTIIAGIFVDGKMEDDSVVMTRQDTRQPINIDLTGARTLVIKVTGRYLCLVDGVFKKKDERPTLFEEASRLDKIKVVDSKQYHADDDLLCDSYGVLHDRSARFLEYSWFSRPDAYALYNLNKEYYHFECEFVTADSIFPNEFFSVKITCKYDDGTEKVAYEKNNITKNEPPEKVAIDVKDAVSMKIEVSSDGSYVGSLYLVDDFLHMHQHVLGDSEILKNASCTEDGEEVRRCSICGFEIENAPIPALGHTPSNEWSIVKAASCSEKGEEVRYCTVCNEVVERRAIDKLEHTPSETWQIMDEPTCNKPGLRQNKCTVCGEVISEEIIEKTEHSFGAWTTISGNIWKNPIVKERTCAKCGEVEYEESYPTRWLIPVIIVIVIVLILLAVVVIVLLVNGLPLNLKGLRNLIRRMKTRW